MKFFAVLFAMAVAISGTFGCGYGGYGLGGGLPGYGLGGGLPGYGLAGGLGGGCGLGAPLLAPPISPLGCFNPCLLDKKKLIKQACLAKYLCKKNLLAQKLLYCC